MAKLAELAAKAERKPYELELDDGTVVLVPQPTVLRFREAVEADDMASMLRVLGVPEGDAAKVAAVTEAAPYGTETALISDMQAYFQLGN